MLDLLLRVCGASAEAVEFGLGSWLRRWPDDEEEGWLHSKRLRLEGAATQGKKEVDLQAGKGREKEGISFRIREIC